MPKGWLKKLFGKAGEQSPATSTSAGDGINTNISGTGVNVETGGILKGALDFITRPKSIKIVCYTLVFIILTLALLKGCINIDVLERLMEDFSKGI